MVRRATVLLWSGLFVCSLGAVAADQRKPKVHTVTIEDMRFEPEELTVASGDTVVWRNNDIVAHTATSETSGFDSKTIQVGRSWKLTVKTKGDVDYICTFHPTMKATLRVR